MKEIDIEKLRKNLFEDGCGYCRDDSDAYERKCADLQDCLEECLNCSFTGEELSFMRIEGIL